MTDLEKNTLAELKTIYTDISNWLKFAEAKHAAFIAVIIGILSLVKDIHETTICGIGIFVTLCMGLPSIIAQMPFLNRKDFIRKSVTKYYRNKRINSNILFYLSIYLESQKGRQQFKTEYLARMGVSNSENIFIDSYLEQIIDISEIATIKYYLFEVAMKMLVVVSIIYILLMIWA